MHRKRAEIQIGEEGSRHPFSNSDQQRRVACFVLGQPRLQNLRIQIPIVHSCHEQICSSSLALHRRHIMSQSPCPTSHLPTQYNKGHFHSYSHKATFFCANPPSVLCLHLYWIRLVLLMLPFLYFFVSHPRLSIPVELIPIVVFSIVLLVSLSLALPRLPSIRLFLARSFPSKFTPVSSPNTPPPVVWSIGCKTKLEKCPSSGSSVQVYSNGDVYEGEFHGGKCSGSGVYYYYKSGRYEGDWVDGKYDGFGIETWAKGSKYRGQYRQGLRNGVGVYRFFTGDVYAGEWSNGQSHGSGVHNCEDGSRYSGEFKWGVKHGLGHYHFRNGDTYAGEYFADKMHGFGVYRFGNGHRYEGAWHEGRRQGFGMYSFRNGEAECGHWQNGFIDVLSRPSTDASSPSDLIHPKVLNAVQEACRAADRAQNMPNVDERVKRAVAAANRSANAARVAAVKAVQNQMHQDISIHDLPMAVV